MFAVPKIQDNFRAMKADTRSKIIQATELRGLVRQSMGLIGVTKAASVWFRTRFGIHTFGVRFPIDVLILGPDMRVEKRAQHLKPNRFFFWPLEYNIVVELPAGEIQKRNLRIGDTVQLTRIR